MLRWLRHRRLLRVRRFTFGGIAAGQPGTSPLCLLLSGAAIWSFSSGLEIASASEMYWNGVLYIGIVTAPAAMLLFALDYGGR
jgi:hypothetical protein